MPITKEEQLDRCLGSIVMCLNICQTESGGTPEWFVSFGTLLGIVRDRGKLLGDIDISMLYEENVSQSLVDALCQFNFSVTKKIIHPDTGQMLYVSLEPLDKVLYGDNHLDIFFWYKVGDLYYHTYDYDMTNPQNGIPETYVFKGVEARILRGATWHETWPEMKHIVRLPHYYGSLLDYWYPGFFRKDSMFGQSRTKQFVQVKTPKDLENPQIVGPQIEKSTAEYEEFKDGYRRISRL